MRREWIEITMIWDWVKHLPSPSMRREWIEIKFWQTVELVSYCLPPCGGSGLKYHSDGNLPGHLSVSLHAEGVD